MFSSSPPPFFPSHLIGNAIFLSNHTVPLSPFEFVPSYFTVLRPFTVSEPIFLQVPPLLLGRLSQSEQALSMSRAWKKLHIRCPAGPLPCENSIYILRSGIRMLLIPVDRFVMIAPPPIRPSPKPSIRHLLFVT